MVVCAVGIVLWLTRLRTRGASACFMAAAFAALGLLLHLIRIEAPVWSRWATGIVLAALVAADIGTRAARQSGGRT